MKKVILFLFTLLVVSCNKEIEKPDNLMRRDVFKSVLAEMYVYKQAPTATNNMPYVEQNKISMSILKKHNIPIEQFKSSMEYYMVENTDYENILKEIQDSLRQLLPKGTLQENRDEIMLNDSEIE